MFRFSAAALLALVASTAAYSVTKPENGTIWDPSQSQVIAWEKVNTDPSTFAITLVHQVSQARIQRTLHPELNSSLLLLPTGIPTQHPYLAVGKTWHKACLRCTECGKTLDSGQLVDKDNDPFCRRCYGKVCLSARHLSLIWQAQLLMESQKFGPQGSGYALLGKPGG